MKITEVEALYLRLPEIKARTDSSQDALLIRITAASPHFLAAVPNALALEYCLEPSEIGRAPARNPIKLEGGWMRVPEEPGLGVEPNMGVVEKYLVRD